MELQFSNIDMHTDVYVCICTYFYLQTIDYQWRTRKLKYEQYFHKANDYAR